MPDPPQNSDSSPRKNVSGKRVHFTRRSWGVTIGRDLQDNFFNRVGMQPLLTAQEEVEWARKYIEAKENLYELLQQVPALFVAVMNSLVITSSRTRITSYFQISGKTESTTYSNALRAAFNKALAKLSAIPPEKLLYSPGRNDKVFRKAMGPLSPRDLFYDTCLEQLRDDKQRSFFIPDAQWPALKIQLDREYDTMKQAENTLVERNLRLVISIAMRFVCSGMQLADLIQEGCIGLMTAIKRYDYKRGYRFATYASYWIRQAIRCCITDHSRIIRMPSSTVAQLSLIKQTEQQLLTQNGVPPTTEEIAQVVKLSTAKVRALMKMAQQPVSLQSIIKDNITFEDAISADNEQTFIDENDMDSLRETLSQILNTLDDVEKKVIRLRFGLDNGECKTLAQISTKLGYSSERVRQIERSALHKMRLPEILEILKGFSH